MAQIGANDPRAYRASLRALIGWSVADRIGEIRCPVLIVASDHDYTPMEWKGLYASQIPGAPVAVLEDFRHAAPMDQAGQFNKVVMRFLAATSPSMPIESPAG